MLHIWCWYWLTRLEKQTETKINSNDKGIYRSKKRITHEYNTNFRGEDILSRPHDAALAADLNTFVTKFIEARMAENLQQNET